jgi:hypothetical protein
MNPPEDLCPTVASDLTAVVRDWQVKTGLVVPPPNTQNEPAVDVEKRRRFIANLLEHGRGTQLSAETTAPKRTPLSITNRPLLKPHEIREQAALEAPRDPRTGRS